MNTTLPLPPARRPAACRPPVLPHPTAALPALPAPSAPSAPPAPPAPPPLDLRAVLGAEAWGRLPAAVQSRFAAGHAAATYSGRLSMQCSAVGRVLAWLARPLNAPLRSERGTDLPARVEVHGDGQGGVVWTRWLRGRALRSTKSAHPECGLWEVTDGGLAMALDVFEQGGVLVFQSRRYVWRRGRLQLPVPGWLTPGRCRVEHRDLGGGRFRFSLCMDHPLWGRTFTQTGEFLDPPPCPSAARPA